MFGEDTIYGRTEIKKDNKNRIVLPAFTYAEFNDSLLILNNKDFIDIYSELDFNKILDNLELKIKNSNNKKEENILKKDLLKMYELVIKKVKCDNQRRINIYPMYNEESKLICIGARDHIMVKRIEK